ncbi:MAG: YSC84-related protein [Geminicoccaceae bacterium]
MTALTRRMMAVVCGAAFLAACASTAPDESTGVSEVDTRADAALSRLLSENDTASTLADNASGILIVPDIVKAGLGIGAATGNGVLRVDGESVAYYNMTAANIGFQIGAQTFSQVLMFMNDAALENFQNSPNFEAGVEANVAVVQAGATGDIKIADLLNQDVVAFIFGETGLMAGATIEGSKYTRINN